MTDIEKQVYNLPVFKDLNFNFGIKVKQHIHKCKFGEKRHSEIVQTYSHSDFKEELFRQKTNAEKKAER